MACFWLHGTRRAFSVLRWWRRLNKNFVNRSDLNYLDYHSYIYRTASIGEFSPSRYVWAWYADLVGVAWWTLSSKIHSKSAALPFWGGISCEVRFQSWRKIRTSRCHSSSSYGWDESSWCGDWALELSFRILDTPSPSCGRHHRDRIYASLVRDWWGDVDSWLWSSKFRNCYIEAKWWIKFHWNL